MTEQFHCWDYTLGILNTNPKEPMHPMFIAALFTIAKCWKQPKCPSVKQWIQKLWYIHTIEFYAAERKKVLLPIATAWMNLDSIILSEISQIVKDKYHMISSIRST